MLTNPEQTVAPVNFLSLLLVLVFPTLSQAKVYHYTQQADSIDYVFEVTTDGSQAHMTGYGKGIKRGDYLVLTYGRYQVEEIDYYTTPSHLWTASLIKVLE
ncbi:MAG: hypothetical protein LH679_20310 [Cyanobacteria bacterium CAN_BIN43]|nr:hypothetical protein [Cyanobacteria bacterium CAN_BIN43]